LTELPSEIVKLTNLTELVLMNNQLTALPHKIRKLTKLTKLDLTSNQLRIWPKTSFLNLRNRVLCRRWLS